MTDELSIKELVHSPPTDLLAWAVMHLMTDSGVTDFLSRFGIDASNHDNTVRVELKINGVEVSPRAVFAEPDRQHTEMVKRQAMGLIREKCSEASEALRLMHELREFAERRAADALGADWKDRW